MINHIEVARTDFEDSHLFNKLRKMVVVGRVFESQAEESSLLHSAATFDLDDPLIYKQVKNDYNEIQERIITQGFDKLTGSMGVLIQPRTKGPGNGSTSRVFYGRTRFVAHILLGNKI